MLARILPLIAVFSLCAAAAGAQPPANGHAAPAEPFTFKGDAELQAMAIKPGAAITLGMLSDHENYYVQVAGRTTNGEPEFHPHWIDYVVVQKGEGTLTWGGTNSGARDTGGGELRGGAIVGGMSRDLHPGDYFEMPAGVWHQILLKPGTSAFRYMVVKIRQ